MPAHGSKKKILVVCTLFYERNSQFQNAFLTKNKNKNYPLPGKSLELLKIDTFAEEAAALLFVQKNGFMFHIRLTILLDVLNSYLMKLNNVKKYITIFGIF